MYFTTSVKTMADIWMGDETYRKAMRNGFLKVVGERNLTQNIASWLCISNFAHLPSAKEI